MKKYKFITSKCDTMGGMPCIIGTRIPIAVIIQRLKEGYTIKEIQKGYPWVPLKILEGAVNELIEKLSSAKDAQKIIQTQIIAG